MFALRYCLSFLILALLSLPNLNPTQKSFVALTIAKKARAIGVLKYHAMS